MKALQAPLTTTRPATHLTSKAALSTHGWTAERSHDRPSHSPRPADRRAVMRAAWPLALITLIAASTSATAAAGEPWTFTASQALQRDDNLFRLDTNAAPPSGVSRADTIARTTVSADWDARIGRQQLQAGAALRAVRHADNDVLDHTGQDLRLTWLAQTAGRLNGELALRRARQLRSPDSLLVGGSAVRNLETDEAIGGVIRLGGEGRLALEAALGARQLDLSVPTAGSAGQRSRTVSLGTRWRPAAATTLGAAWRHTEGRYPALDEDWRLNAIDLSVDWDRGSRTRVWARLSPVQLRHDRLTARDVSGLNSAAQLQWQATPKASLVLRVQREIGADVGLERWGEVAGVAWPGTGDDARLLRRISLDLTYAISAKVSVTAGAAHIRRDLVALSAAPSAPVASEDRTSRLALGASWQATRRVSVGCEAAVERRRVDGTLSTPYLARTTGCVAQLSF